MNARINEAIMYENVVAYEFDGPKLEMNLDKKIFFVYQGDMEDDNGYVDGETWYMFEFQKYKKDLNAYLSNKKSLKALLAKVNGNSDLYLFKRMFEEYDVLSYIDQLEIKYIDKQEYPTDDSYLGFDFIESSGINLLDSLTQTPYNVSDYINKDKQLILHEGSIDTTGIQVSTSKFQATKTLMMPSDSSIEQKFLIEPNVKYSMQSLSKYKTTIGCSSHLTKNRKYLTRNGAA